MRNCLSATQGVFNVGTQSRYILVSLPQKRSLHGIGIGKTLAGEDGVKISSTNLDGRHLIQSSKHEISYLFCLWQNFNHYIRTNYCNYLQNEPAHDAVDNIFDFSEDFEVTFTMKNGLWRILTRHARHQNHFSADITAFSIFYSVGMDNVELK